MGLQEAASGKRFTPSKLEESDHITNARAKINARTFEKVCRTIDDAIEEAVAKKTPKLVWLNTGSLVGDHAGISHESHEHLWGAVLKVFPNATDPVAVKGRRITVGALNKWRVALRREDWLVHYRETDKTDIVTGELIKASEYWIKPATVVLAPPPRSKASSKTNKFTVEDLMDKFNKR